YLKVETKLVGGPGEITGSAIVKEGDDYKVEWKLPESITNEKSETYNHYLVDKVIINGEGKNPDTVTQAEFKSVSEDNKVIVVLKPNLKKVETEVEGSGTIDASTTLFYGQKYSVKAKAEPGYYLSQIEHNGQITHYENPEISRMSRSVKSQTDEQIILDQVPIKEDQHIKATFKRMDGQEEAQSIKITTHLEGGKGTITSGGPAEKGS
ncbi:MAG: hypothetical protein RR614_16190, partial [Eubacterium sp.]